MLWKRLLALVLAFTLVLAFAAPAASVVVEPTRVRWNELATVDVGGSSVQPNRVELVDLNGDGDGDLVVITQGPVGSRRLKTYRGNGKGGFAPVTNFELGDLAGDLAFGEFTGDSDLDIAVLMTTTLPITSGIRIYAGDGNCGFGTTPVDTAYGFVTPSSIEAVNLTGDADMDVAVALRYAGFVHFYENDGTGNLSWASQAPLPGGVILDMDTGWIDGDGYRDLAVLDQGNKRVRLYEGASDTGSGLTQIGNPIPIGNGALAVVVDDFDWRHWGDIAVLNNNDDDVSVLLANGTSGAAGWSRTDYPVAGDPEDLAAFNGDPNTPADLAVLSPSSKRLRVLLNNGFGGIGSVHNTTLGPGNVAVGAGYVKRDAKEDLAIADLSDTSVHVLENWFLPQVERLAGANRYETAVEVADEAVDDVWGAPYVVVATGADYPDALAGVPLALAVGGAPILLTPTDELPDDVAAEIVATGANNAYVLGGTAAVSDAVVAQLTSKAGIPAANITRLAGADRYETSYQIAMELEAAVPWDTIHTAYVATGENYPDALTGAIPAAYEYAPILLTRRDSLPAPTQAAFGDLAITETVVLGGTSVVSADVMAELPSPFRLAGDNRYATGRAIADYAMGDLDFWAINILVATGEAFPDALAAGPLGSPGNQPFNPLLLVRPDSVPPETAGFIAEHARDCSRVYVIGGTSAVSNEVVGQLEALY